MKLDEPAVPFLEAYLVPGPGLHPAVLICPGGGYGYLSTRYEGTNVARWFVARGCAALVLHYRLPKLGLAYAAPLLDAQRALRLVRHRAPEWQLDSKRLGLIGFSAGGHLAGLVATGAKAGAARAADPIDRESARADFLILVYPVVTMESGGANSRSLTNLLGPRPDPQLARALSLERRVTARMPPTLLLYADDDPIVPPLTNGAALAAALARVGAPHQVITFSQGGHGWGLGREPERGPGHWIDRMEAWLRAQKVW